MTLTDDAVAAVERAYTRRPGLETRLMPAMDRSRFGPYFRVSVRVWPTRASETSQPEM